MGRIKLKALLKENVPMFYGNVRVDASTGFIYHGDNIILTDEDVTELKEMLEAKHDTIDFNDRYKVRIQFQIIDTIDDIVQYISEYDIQQLIKLQANHQLATREDFEQIKNNQKI